MELNDILADELIREMNAEVDADTIRRFNRGERLIHTDDGLEWVYVVDKKNQRITDPDKLKSVLGDLMC